MQRINDKGVCDTRFIWNPSNCECDCDKVCNVGEYLDCENCKCRKRLVDQLVDECAETNITLAENENGSKFSSCTVSIVLFSKHFTTLELLLVLFIHNGI